MNSIIILFAILCFNSLCYGNVIKSYDGELEYSDYNETTQSDHRIRSIEESFTNERPDGLDQWSSEEISKATESSTELDHDSHERMGPTESVYTSPDPVTSMVMTSTLEPRQSEITTTEGEKIDSRENISMRSYEESTTPLNVDTTNQNVFNQEVASQENTSQEVTSQENASQENTSQVQERSQERSQEERSQEKTSQSTTEPTTTEPSISQDNYTETGDFKRKNESNVYYKKVVEVNNFFNFKSNSENQVEAIKDPSANNTKNVAKSGSFSLISNFVLLVNLFVFSKFLF